VAVGTIPPSGITNDAERGNCDGEEQRPPRAQKLVDNHGGLAFGPPAEPPLPKPDRRREIGALRFRERADLILTLERLRAQGDGGRGPSKYPMLARNSQSHRLAPKRSDSLPCRAEHERSCAPPLRGRVGPVRSGDAKRPAHSSGGTPARAEENRAVLRRCLEGSRRTASAAPAARRIFQDVDLGSPATRRRQPTDAIQRLRPGPTNTGAGAADAARQRVEGGG